jgi:dolichyl-phosphate-mannose-protein mannosyltransferase
MIPLLILAVSAVVHFIHFGHPAAVVFDEVHAGNFLTHYWIGSYFFDVHPPLGKLLEVAFGYVTGVTGLNIDWDHIGNALPQSAVLLRLIPMIAGTLLPVIVYAIGRRLGFSKTSAAVAALLICFENSLVVQSRFILFDIVMLFFGFLGILAYLEYRRRGLESLRTVFMIISALCTAAAFGIKWTGLAFVLVIVLMELFTVYTENKAHIRARLRSILISLSGFVAFYAIVIAVVYFILFSIHFALLPRTGPGDAFMSSEFNQTLVGSTTTAVAKPGTPPGPFGKFFELNLAMYEANLRLNTPHQYSSKWYTWPLMIRPIYYWHGGAATSSATSTAPTGDQSQSYIYLIGNPFIYWLGAALILTLTLYSLAILFRRSEPPAAYLRTALFSIVIGFLANFLPFIWIGRVMFLYHYEAALVWTIFAIAFIVETIPREKRRIAATIVLVLAIAAFIFWSPLTYGTPLTPDQYSSRMWFPSWR